MRYPALVAAGTVIAVLGLVFTLQGVGVLEGSSMSNTTTWSIAGPIIVVIGAAVAAFGFRPRQ
jgi:drug/metabolite transporter superfamily protein YnfA